MLDIILSVLSGGVTGLVGTVLSETLGFFKARQQHNQELELRRLDIEIAQAEAAGAEKVAAIEAEAQADKAAWGAFEASHRAAQTRWSRPGDSWEIRIVDVVRGLTRPGLTWLGTALVAVIYFTLLPDDWDLRERIVQSVIYLTTAAWLWWFGSRQVAKISPPPVVRFP